MEEAPLSDRSADLGTGALVQLIRGRSGGPQASGGPVLMLGSNDYLGLAGDDRLVRAAARALERYGCGLGLNPPFATTALHEELREVIADFSGTEDALLFGSCTAANVALLATLGRERTGSILSDANNHASIVDGCRLARASTIVYPTCDAAAVARQLERLPPDGERINPALSRLVPSPGFRRALCGGTCGLPCQRPRDAPIGVFARGPRPVPSKAGVIWPGRPVDPAVPRLS